MNAAQIGQQAAQKRAAMLAKLQPVKIEARAKLEGLQTETRNLQEQAQEAKETRAITAGHHNDLFVTPKPLAARIIEEAGIQSGMKVLEPSAGTGRLAEAILQAGAVPHCVEFNYTLAERLINKGYRVDQCDFMTWESPEFFDAVTMNPPFSNSADINHVMRAYTFLKAGGVLVAIMGAGAFFRSDKKASKFRAWLDEVNGESEELPPGTFSQSGTNVNTRLVIIHKGE